jgi:hypothetical protein
LVVCFDVLAFARQKQQTRARRSATATPQHSRVGLLIHFSYLTRPLRILTRNKKRSISIVIVIVIFISPIE